MALRKYRILIWATSFLGVLAGGFAAAALGFLDTAFAGGAASAFGDSGFDFAAAVDFAAGSAF